ncbi:hypothetical protein ACFSYC_00230 [Mucilaginibacter antarcticus]|uniref:Tetratricopeptide repeat protein n=2 Tax=Mucilaginibacter antarcticus TaxID=1855725 RepID=A0ABW5XIC0_9SPHI
MTRYNVEWYGKNDHYNPHENYMVIKDQYPDDVIIRHATILLITGNALKVVDTLRLSNKIYRPGDRYYPFKQLLLAAANYIIKPSAFEQLKNALADTIAKTGPILEDEYTSFSFARWLSASNYTDIQQQNLSALYNIALTPLPVVVVDLIKTDSTQSRANRIALLFKRFDNVRKGSMDDKKQWQTIVDLADEMIRIDSLAYNRFIDWYFIGLGRFKTGDFQGTVNDFDRYLKQNPIDFYDNVRGAKYKVQAHLALGQTLKAAKTFEDLDIRRGPKTNGLQEAAVIYKGAGENAKFKTLINTALKRSKKNLDSVTIDLAYNRGGFALDHAELLVIADKRKEAAKLLNTYDAPYDRGNLAVKAYLLNGINVLNGKKSSSVSTKQIIEFMGGQYKFNVWDFTMFNRWLKYSGLDEVKQKELLDLQKLIDENS